MCLGMKGSRGDDGFWDFFRPFKGMLELQGRWATPSETLSLQGHKVIARQRTRRIAVIISERFSLFRFKTELRAVGAGNLHVSSLWRGIFCTGGLETLISVANSESGVIAKRSLIFGLHVLLLKL